MQHKMCYSTIKFRRYPNSLLLFVILWNKISFSIEYFTAKHETIEKYANFVE